MRSCHTFQWCGEVQHFRPHKIRLWFQNIEFIQKLVRPRTEVVNLPLLTRACGLRLPYFWKQHRKIIVVVYSVILRRCWHGVEWYDRIIIWMDVRGISRPLFLHFVWRDWGISRINAVRELPEAKRSATTLSTIQIILVAKWGTSRKKGRNWRRFLYESGRKHLIRSDCSSTCS
jgi:hypothetical protein